MEKEFEQFQKISDMIAAPPEKLFVREGRTLTEYIKYEKRKER